MENKIYKILVACGSGMSSAIIEKRMKEYCFKNKIQAEIKAVPMGQIKIVGDSWDAIVIAPQISFALQDLRNTFPNKPVELIPSNLYALGKGDKVMEMLKPLLGIN